MLIKMQEPVQWTYFIVRDILGYEVKGECQMKRNIVFLLFALFISVILSSCGPPLSEEELQRRADNYTLLVDSLRAVGYDSDFKSLRERKSIEENLRILWRDRKVNGFDDSRKNAELLVLLGNFDFIAEGLRRNASDDNPHYYDWPRNSQYEISSESISFDGNEVLWLMLLLPDADFPEDHLGLRDVLIEAGGNALMRDSLGNVHITSMSVWFYYEKTNPGLLEQVNPDFQFLSSDEMKIAFLSANNDIQNRFVQAIDAGEFRYIRYPTSPARVFSSDEAEALMQAFPPMGFWDGGYIRIADLDRRKYDINTSSLGAFIYEEESNSLVPVIDPADARFAIFEVYTDGTYYASYTGYREMDAYLLHLDIRIVDLLTGDEIFNESILSNPPPDEITWTTLHGIGFGEPRVVDGKYFHCDFDFSRYAAVMEAHLNQY